MRMLQLFAITSLIVLSIVVGLNIQPTPLATPSPSASNNIDKKFSQLQSKIEQLETALNAEIENHNNTRKQLAELNLALKQAIKQTLKTEINSAQSNGTDNSEKNEQTLANVNEPRLPESQRNRNILISMGVDSHDANRIQQLTEKKEMEQLYLRNTAAREGWFGTEKYFEKTRELDLESNIYREELGDDKYDQFLYSSQLTNRIVVQSVLSESPAENTGLLAGDYILSYDNKRVFNWSDLTALTANGEVGENIPIEVQRNDQVFQYFIARGPLGIRLNSERVSPNQP